MALQSVGSSMSRTAPAFFSNVSGSEAEAASVWPYNGRLEIKRRAKAAKEATSKQLVDYYDQHVASPAGSSISSCCRGLENEEEETETLQEQFNRTGELARRLQRFSAGGEGTPQYDVLCREAGKLERRQERRTEPMEFAVQTQTQATNPFSQGRGLQNSFSESRLVSGPLRDLRNRIKARKQEVDSSMRDLHAQTIATFPNYNTTNTVEVKITSKFLESRYR
eukprot:TRINITY_DN76512_c0_g1_i1.p1 TRINITY_DN76512_c0_g1~~TRINITY_DN76512_c0_g1_i1.p1  ORF type:complete len:223 (+),score=31.66 TRINITY_DN76512_c0_g1_i1:63-731(+)